MAGRGFRGESPLLNRIIEVVEVHGCEGKERQRKNELKPVRNAAEAGKKRSCLSGSVKTQTGTLGMFGDYTKRSGTRTLGTYADCTGSFLKMWIGTLGICRDCKGIMDAPAMESISTIGPF